MTPTAAPRQCARSHCPALVHIRGRYLCDSHEAERQRVIDARRDRVQHKFYASTRWRRIRRAQLLRNPLCEEFQRSERTTPATEVHHRETRVPGGSDSHENLESLCKSCHARHTAKYDGGFGNRSRDGNTCRSAYPPARASAQRDSLPQNFWSVPKSSLQ